MIDTVLWIVLFVVVIFAVLDVAAVLLLNKYEKEDEI